MKKLLFASILLWTSVTAIAQPVDTTANRIRVRTAPSGACTAGQVAQTAAGEIYSCISGTWGLSGSVSITDATATVKGKAVLGQTAVVATASLGTCAAGNVGQIKRVTDNNKGTRICTLTTGSTYAWVDDDPVYRPEKFGAAGSGTETTALQALITAAAGKVVVLTKGASYTVDSALSVPASTTIDLNGATITASGDHNIFNISAVSNVTIKNGTLTGTGSTWAANVNAINATGTTNGVGVAPTYISNIRIEDIIISNFKNAGILFLNVRDSNVIRPKITNVGYVGVACESCLDVIVDGAGGGFVDTVVGETSSGHLNAYGVYFSQVNGSDSVRYPSSERCVVKNMTIKNIPTWEGLDTHAGVDCQFLYNTIIDVRRGIAIVGQSGAAARGASGSKVIGNIIRNSLSGTNSNGTTKVEEALIESGISAGVRNSKNEFKDNLIYQQGGRINTNGAVYVGYSNDAVFENNTITEPYYTGFYLDAEVSRLVAERNTVINPKSIGVANGASSDVALGVRSFGDNLVDIKFTKNTFIRTQNVGSGTGETLTYGWLLSAAATRSMLFRDNVVHNPSTANYFVGGTASQVTIEGGIRSLSGTANQVNIADSSGALTLSLPQSIATTSNVQFGALSIGTPSFGQLLNINSSSAASLASFQQSGTTKAIIGIDNSANNIIVGGAVGDTVIRAQNQSILFSTDSGTSAQLKLATGGTSTFGGPLAAASYRFTNLLSSSTAPTVTSAGTSPSIVANNGTAAFEADVGTGGTAHTIVFTMPAATTGWICTANNITAAAANRADWIVRQTASTTTSVTIQSQKVSDGTALAFTASDRVRVTCVAY